MIRHTAVLDGPGWTMREALGETWRWYIDAPLDEWHNNAAEAAARPAPGWWPAHVPGSVVSDLARAGELEDPYRARQSRSAEWTGTRSWVYRRGVTTIAAGDAQTSVLEFGGLDPSGAVYWDGRLLGRVEGTYRPARFPLSADDALAGRHRLTVVLDPVPPSQPQVGRTDLVRTHRPRLNEGWDFCPPFPHQGIWRSVRLVTARVHAAEVTARAALDDAGYGRVTVAARLDPAEGPVPYRLSVTGPGGELVDEERGSCDGLTLQADLAVAQPRLWWPHGMGEQPLYTLTLRLDGADEPAWQGSIGFRSAELVANAGAPAGARGYTARVNGQFVPLVGWNWVPADAQYGSVVPERVVHLVELAARSGARLLRVWGGGLIETDEFYDACDRAGLLVWQEFSQSSSGQQSAPAADEQFVALMRTEAETVVPARAHHPSLFIWGGGNELDLDGVPLDENGSPVLAALRDTVHRLDPGRAWLPTSPSGPRFHFRDGGHDVHGPWEHQGLRTQHALYNAGTCLAHTEFGVEGMTNRRALSELVPVANRWPADRTNPVYRHLGDWWNNAPLVQAAFGNRLADVESLRRASQLLQATGLAYAIEADRRRFPSCSMVLPWQLNESYPNAWCTSCVDHAGNPKPAYHAAARAFAPRRVTVRVPMSVWAGETRWSAQAWVWSERATAAGSRVHARLRDADGIVLAERGWRLGEPVTEPRAVGTLEVDAGTVPAGSAFVWDVAWVAPDGAELDRDVVIACTGSDFAPLLDLAAASVSVTTTAAEVRVAHRAGPMIVGLELLDDRPAGSTGWVMPSGDPRPLLPGRSRTFTVAGARGPLRLEAWNLPAIAVDLKEPVR